MEPRSRGSLCCHYSCFHGSSSTSVHSAAEPLVAEVTCKQLAGRSKQWIPRHRQKTQFISYKALDQRAYNNTALLIQCSHLSDNITKFQPSNLIGQSGLQCLQRFDLVAMPSKKQLYQSTLQRPGFKSHMLR